MVTKRVSVVAVAVGASPRPGGLPGSTTGAPGAGGESGSGMIEQLTFPSDAPNTIGGLVDYNPYSPTP